MADLEKTVFVEVVSETTSNMNLEISFSNVENSGVSDLTCVVAAMKKKKPLLISQMQEGSYLFQLESTKRPGKWVTIGDESPLKSNCDV